MYKIYLQYIKYLLVEVIHFCWKRLDNIIYDFNSTYSCIYLKQDDNDLKNAPDGQFHKTHNNCVLKYF